MDADYVPRLLQVPSRSFFLFGPRGVGKSTWLAKVLPDALLIDLLESSLLLELSQDPGRLGAMTADLSSGSWIVIDEIQKVPELLNEVHRLIEKRGLCFALSGSSARKLRRGGTNLLGGRALTRTLDTFSYGEIAERFDLDAALEWGMLPGVQRDLDNADDILSAYVDTYLRQEIKEEGIVRKLPPFARFLGIAGQLNAQLVNRQNVARDAAVPRSTVDSYFSILEDTLVGRFLPAYRPKVKVRECAHPKFYWFDPGVARAAAGLLFDPVDRFWKGAALETLIYHELLVHNHIHRKNRQIGFYRTAAGAEIDFIIETRKRQHASAAHVVCLEVKLAPKWNNRWEQPMRDLESQGSIRVEKMAGIYTGDRKYRFNGVDVFPVTEFLRSLHQGEIF